MLLLLQQEGPYTVILTHRKGMKRLEHVVKGVRAEGTWILTELAKEAHVRRAARTE